jgi:hypothetical protein
MQEDFVLMDAPPLIVRVAGLPSETVEAFSSDLCTIRVQDLSRLEQELQQAQAEMVERLHVAVHEASPDLRRFLLTVKRDCFNGRSLGKHRGASEWPELHLAAGFLVDRILGLEEQILAWHDEFTALYARERKRERLYLLNLLADRHLRRGIALASPEVLRACHRLLGNPATNGRKERKIEESLLRYVSRAAFKLSPFSTLTRVALCTIQENLEGGQQNLLGSRWCEISLMRLKRYLLNQLFALLLHYPGFRAGLRTRLNDTIEEISLDRYRLLRPSRWDLDENGKRFRSFQEATVTVSLSGPLISWLRTELPRHDLTFSELAAVLRETFSGLTCPERIDATLTKLSDIGFLRLSPPWPTNELYPERSLLIYLHSLTRDEVLNEVICIFERIVALEAGYPDAENPVLSVEELEALVDEAWNVARPLAGINPDVTPDGARIGRFNEDVFLLPSNHPLDRREVYQIPEGTAERIRSSVQPLLKFSYLFDSRHDFRHTLEALAAERWPGQREVSLLELFNAAQPLWREYTQFAGTNSQNSLREPFNPLRAGFGKDLCRLRRQVWEGVRQCVRIEGEETRIDGELLEDLLRHVPDRYTPSVGPCLFIQPADTMGDRWVVNRILDGTGRYESRFTAPMDEETRRLFTSHLATCSVLERDGECLELLDLMASQVDNLNVHPPQTLRVLELPGETCTLPLSRRLRLGDLRVRFDSPGRPPRLVDFSGKILLPVHLGTMALRIMPPMVRFLALFGPTDFSLLTPPRRARRAGDVEIQDRLTIGCVVLGRKKWLLAPGAFRQSLLDLPEPESFVTFHRWRLALGIPDQVFFADKTPAKFLDKDVYKPQYLDLTSPIFQTVLRSALKDNDYPLSIEEMLPAPESFPRDNEGSRWAVELQLETLVFGSCRSGSVHAMARSVPAASPTASVR